MAVKRSYYIAELDGNGSVTLLNKRVSTGPHYDETIWLDKEPYPSKEEAEKALDEYFNSSKYPFGEYFIMESYGK